MMNKNRKKSSIFFLSVAGLFILLHAITPHHHHDPYFSHQNDDSQTCPSEKNNTKDTPLHCHAFNETTISRIKAVAVEIPYTHNTNLFSLTISEHLLSIDASENAISFSNNVTPPKQYLLFYSLLRAPPLF